MSFDVKPWQSARVRGVRGEGGEGGEGALAWKRNSKTEKAQQMKGSRQWKSLLLLQADPDVELKEHPFWSRCVDGIQEVCAATWTDFPPLRASLLIRAVEPQQLEDTFN